jgi:hypothetical protein
VAPRAASWRAGAQKADRSQKAGGGGRKMPSTAFAEAFGGGFPFRPARGNCSSFCRYDHWMWPKHPLLPRPPGAGRARPADTSRAGAQQAEPLGAGPKTTRRANAYAENKAHRVDPTRILVPKAFGLRGAATHSDSSRSAATNQPIPKKQERPQPLWLIKAASGAAGRLLCLQRRSEPRTPSPSRRHAHRDCRPVHAADDGSAD